MPDTFSVALPVATWLHAFVTEACELPQVARYQVLLKDLALYHAMRRDSHMNLDSESLSNDEMATLIWGCRMPAAG
jgi:hypothetical protein